jgi:hypothetical protein
VTAFVADDIFHDPDSRIFIRVDGKFSALKGFGSKKYIFNILLICKAERQRVVLITYIADLQGAGVFFQNDSVFSFAIGGSTAGCPHN